MRIKLAYFDQVLYESPPKAKIGDAMKMNVIEKMSVIKLNLSFVYTSDFALRFNTKKRFSVQNNLCVFKEVDIEIVRVNEP